MDGSMRRKIESVYGSLRPSERKAADYLLEYRGRAGDLLMEELAGAAGVSQPTVMRFVKALGYGGFREFKYALVQEEARGQRKEGEIELYGFQLSSRDRLEEIPGKIVATSIRMLEETLKSIRAKDYRQAVEAILEARSIVIYSVENSVCTASEIRKIYEAWQIYRQGQKPKVHYVTKSDRQSHELEVSIPGDAHNPRSLDYVTEYFPVASSEDLNAAFRQIAGRITALAQVPTQVSGGDPVHGGYIAYTDPIGEYMEVKDVKTILFSGKRFDRLLDPVTETRADGGSVTTYRFEGQVNSPVYGQHSLSEIQITLETAVDPAGVKEQVLRVKIPASVIPLRVNTITLGGDGKVERNEDNGTYPIRVLYTVGLQPGIADDSGRLTDKVSGDYVSANRNEDGTVNFYSSRYSGSREGQREEASATFTPADTNPYYFVQQDTLLYADRDCVIPAVSLDPGAVYYFRTIYIEGTDIKEGVMERPGELLEGYTQIRDGQLYLKAGSPRLGYLRESAAEKEENFTGTAESVCDPVFRGDPSDGFFEIYLGNNGRLSVSPYQASADREDGTPEVTASPAPGFSDDDAQSEEKPDTPPLTPSPGAEIPGEAADTGDRGSFLPYKAALTAAAAALAVLAAVRTVRKKQSGRF